MRANFKKTLIDILFYIVGCCIYSAGVIIFSDANEISPGGVTGIAIILNHLIGLPTGMLVLIINIPLLIAGFLVFGKRFIVNTTVATVVLSLSLDAMALVVSPYKTDGILAAIFGGIMMGAGLSLVFMRGATTGGTDIAAKLINHRFPFVSMGRIIMLVDFVVVAITAVYYKNFQSGLYSVVLLYASSRVFDSLLYGFDRGKLMHIITTHPDEVSDAVFEQLGRGVTKINAEGAYTGETRPLLLCAVRPSEVSALQKIIKTVDPSAFVVISDAGEILGEGFKKNE